MVTLNEIANALNLDPKQTKQDFSCYGEVKSINADNTYQVSLNGSDTAVKCARLTGARVGDVVLVTVLKNGYAVVTGCVGGDTDASDAIDTATAAFDDASAALEQVQESITTDTIHYLATDLSSGVTINTPGWSTAVQAITAALPYLWTYHTYSKAGGDDVNTQPVITGVYGSTGATGPQGPQGPRGQRGSAGDDGVSVTAVQPQYYLSDSDVTTTGGSWSTTLTYQADKFIWTRDAISYSNSTTGFSTELYNEALTMACNTSEVALDIADAASLTADDALAKAEATAQHFWYDTDGAHVTEIPKDDFISTPSGGNLLLHSNSIKIRRALAVLAELDTDGMTVYNGSGTQLAKFGSRIVLGSPTAAHLEIFNNGITGCEISQYRRNAQGDIVSAPNSILMGYEGEIQIAYTKSSPHQTLVLNSSGVTVGNLRANTETVPIASSDFTTTTGSISSVSMYRFGNVIQLVMQVTKSSATDAGNNVYSGVLKLADYRPKAQIECGSYSGSVAVIGSLETNGTITARVTGAQLPAGRRPVLTFTYLI